MRVKPLKLFFSVCLALICVVKIYGADLPSLLCSRCSLSTDQIANGFVSLCLLLWPLASPRRILIKTAGIGDMIQRLEVFREFDIEIGLHSTDFFLVTMGNNQSRISIRLRHIAQFPGCLPCKTKPVFIRFQLTTMSVSATRVTEAL